MLYWKCFNKPYQSEKKYKLYTKCKQDAEKIAKEYKDIVLIYKEGDLIDQCIETIDKE